MNDGIDPVLQFLVTFVTDSESEGSLGLTVTVGGTLITGQLVSYRTWFHRLEMLAAEQAMSAAQFVGAIGSWVSDQHAQFKGADDEPLPSHVHLADARIVQGAHYPLDGVVTLIPAAPALMWRSRLDRIDGWSLGELGPDSSGEVSR